MQDIRVPIVGSEIPFLYLRYRSLEDRFADVDMRAELVAVSDALHYDEPARLLLVAALLGVDYCEMDCLRDRASGRLYAVDVNTTPWGPPRRLSAEEGEHAIDRLAAAFVEQFLFSSTQSTAEVAGNDVSRLVEDLVREIDEHGQLSEG